MFVFSALKNSLYLLYFVSCVLILTKTELTAMEPDEIWQGKSLLEQLINIIKRTPESLAIDKEGGE